MKKKTAEEQKHIADLRSVRARQSDWYKVQTLAETALNKLDDERERIINKLGYVPYGL